MKKKLALLLVLAMAGSSLAGCGAAKNADNSASNASSGATLGASAGADAASASSGASLVDMSTLKLDDTSYVSGIKLDDYVKLGEYTGLAVTEASPKVSDELVDMYINYYFMQGAAKTKVTDRAVKDGDVVNIDYTGKLKDTGKEFDGGSAKGYDLTIGSKSFIDGFETGLIGKKIGDSVDLDLTFPTSYSSADLAGKEVIFTVKINSISVTPELTDDLVPSFGISGVSTVDQLKSYMHDSLLKQQQSTYDRDVQNQILNAAETNCVFQAPPQAMINRYMIELNNSLENQAAYYTAQGSSVTPEMILQQSMSNASYSGDMNGYLQEAATRQCKAIIMLSAIAAKEGIKVDDAEVSSEASSAMSNNGYSSMDAYSKSVGIDMNQVIKEEALATKVLDFLTEKANISEPASTASSASTAESATAASGSAASESSAKSDAASTAKD